MSMSCRRTLVLPLVIAALLAAGCDPAGESTPRPPPRVGVATVNSGPGEPPVLANGILTNKEELRLSFKVPGIVRRIDVQVGETVTAGQRLADLEPAEVDAQVDEARQLADKATRDLARSERLRADDVISEEELEALRTQAAVAAAVLRTAEFNRSFARIVAPGGGLVLRKLVEEREFVQAGQPVLVVGPEASGFVVRASLSDRDVVRLRRGDPAAITLDAFPGRTLTGRISLMPAAAEPATGLFEIEVEIDNEPGNGPNLVSGLVTRLRLDPAGAGTPALPHAPIAALIEADGDRAAVFVLEQGIARLRPVRVAFIAPETVAIREGLTAGETVITDGALYLEDGQDVLVAAGPDNDAPAAATTP